MRLMKKTAYWLSKANCMVSIYMFTCENGYNEKEMFSDMNLAIYIAMLEEKCKASPWSCCLHGRIQDSKGIPEKYHHRWRLYHHRKVKREISSGLFPEFFSEKFFVQKFAYILISAIIWSSVNKTTDFPQLSLMRSPVRLAGDILCL